MSRSLQDKCSVLFGCALCDRVDSIQGNHWQDAEACTWQRAGTGTGAACPHIIIFETFTAQSCRLNRAVRHQLKLALAEREREIMMMINSCTVEIVWMYLYYHAAAAAAAVSRAHREASSNNVVINSRTVVALVLYVLYPLK